jgi:hypothetical protein
MLVQSPRTLPARRIAPLPALPPLATRVAAAAMLPALAGLLARELVHALLRRGDRPLLRLRGSVVRQADGHTERLTFDADILEPRRRWWLI